MKSHYQLLLISATLGVAELAWYNVHADQQAQTDAGVNFGKSLLGNVQTLSTDTDTKTVPGFGGTDLPETQYYNSQDLSGMQEKAITDINSGAASEVSQYAYQKSLQPKLQFGANDPILLNSGSISTDAMLNPEVLTVQTGSCTTTDVSTPITTTETCTAWLEPTQQTCNKTLNVDVTWENIYSCPIATTFSQVQATHNTSGADDIVYARAFCNFGSGEDMVDIQLKASDGDPGDCTGWVDITASTNQTTEIYSGALLQPQFYSSNTCVSVPAFIQGGCDANNQCNYTVTFRELRSWSAFDDSASYTCSGTAMSLAALGYTGPGDTHPAGLLGNDPFAGYYCVARSTSVNLTFEKPNITKSPTVTDTWNNGCGLLEAQVQ